MSTPAPAPVPRPRASRHSAPALLLLLLALPAFGQFGDLLDARTRGHLTNALDGLNMTMGDLAFAKDIGEPKVALEWTRALLRDPLRAPHLAATVDRAALDPESLWQALPGWLETDHVPASAAAPAPRPEIFATLPAPLPAALARFVAEAAAARQDLEAAGAGLDHAARSYLLAGSLSDVLTLGADGPDRRALLALGLDQGALDRVAAEAGQLDPRPAASNRLVLARAFDRARLLHAARRFHYALAHVALAAQSVTNWPAEPLVMVTEQGRIRIGTPGDDRHDEEALLILDPAGRDVYAEACGRANGLAGPALAGLIDLAGDDRYESAGPLGVAAAWFGAAIVLDRSGDDSYRGGVLTQGSGLFGIGILEDGGGSDRYRAAARAQGAGEYGAGWLWDRAGNDVYEVAQQGQAFAGCLGVGLLIDQSGADRYLAGAGRADTDRHDDHFLSLAQGFSIGQRPFVGGGLAALVDRGGNDVYIADVYGQGAAYWYAAGLLLDGGGHDSYQVFQYGQGSGIHLACGLLADAGGDDRYSGGTLTQGNAHDFGVGFLFERGGNDFYSADTFSQGRAMNNALGVLVDGGGDDVYAARDHTSCQGIGNEGGHRDYGCLGLLLDLGGRDRYSCGAVDNDQLERPLYGAVYDAEDAP